MKYSIATLLLMVTVAAGAAEISAEWPVSSAAYGPAHGILWSAAAASDGTDFLAAWTSAYRNHSETLHLFATRIDASGQVLDPIGILIPALTTWPRLANVVYLGDSYLVCWNEFLPTQSGVLLAIRISRDGTLLDSAPRILAEGENQPAGDFQSSAASNGNRAVIVYTDNSLALRSIVLDRDANIIDGPKPFLPSNALDTMSMRVSSNGDGFLVIQTKQGHTTGVTQTTAVTLDANATRVSTRVLSDPLYEPVLDLASDGDSYVAFVGQRSYAYARHYSADGELLETSTVSFHSDNAALAFVSDSYLFMDLDLQTTTVGVRSLDRAGHPNGSYVPVATGTEVGVLASNGTDAFVNWTESISGANGETTALISSGEVIHGRSLTTSKAARIVTSAKSQTTPAAASNGANIAVVWKEDDGVYTGRLTLDGQLLDGPGIKVGGLGPYQAEPRIVFDGQNYIIGWIESTSSDVVKIARLEPGSGRLLDPGGATIAQPSCRYDYVLADLTLSAGGPGTLVAWSDCDRVNARTVARDLSLSAIVAVSPNLEEGLFRAHAFSAAWNGQEWLVSWEDAFWDPYGTYPGLAGLFYVSIYAARLSSSLELLDRSPIVLSHAAVSPNEGWFARPLVASNGDGFLLVWSELNSGPARVLARRVASDGSLNIETTGVRLATGTAMDLRWDGAQYNVAFSSYSLPQGLYVTHVTSQGPIAGTNPLAAGPDPVAGDFSSIPKASLLVTGPGRVKVLYTRVEHAPEYGEVDRAFIASPHLIRGRAAGAQ